MVAPLLRRYHIASPALAGGALIVIVVSLIGLVHTDPRIGLAAIESNRRFYLLFLACELPVLILVLISWRRFKWAYWVGWAISCALSLYLVAIFIVLEFFWHW